METAHAQVLARRQAIYQTLVQKESAEVQTAQKVAATEATKLPVQQANPSLPDHLGGTVNVRV
ncbi:hypothetical protein [Actomonas aquatica]|uniref:Uncharacterized protein n=1 Tax=Actomonas aquatica TaxID=2866162 RepID=A0ABZ1CGL0_9BACT|nr:hypothetical protein [Opitutus sp. WL0086]WRQ89709.1 hypothetical protein K1X11_009845 [Opitutus sp. WL0086]